MTEIRCLQVDAFTDRPFAGNPAAVCLLDQARDARWMQAVAVEMNVADEEAIKAGVAAGALAFGGLDLVVNNAGLSKSAALEETSAQLWDLQHNVMPRGSFLVSRESALAMRRQGLGGDIVYIASKNAVAAGPKNIAYSSAKASQAHQVRLLRAGPHKAHVPPQDIEELGHLVKSYGAHEPPDPRDSCSVLRGPFGLRIAARIVGH